MKHGLPARAVHAHEPYVAGHHLIKAGSLMAGAKENLPSLERALNSSTFKGPCKPIRHAPQLLLQTKIGLRQKTVANWRPKREPDASP